jgi:glycosyltransferase involved in cell wall biosynthesis
MAAHILPVHESLVHQTYDFHDDGKPAQGYTHFWPKAAKTTFTPVYYGYDDTFFKPNPSVVRQKESFVTIGNLNEPYAFRRKGYDLIIELARIRPDLHFTLVGWDGVRQIDAPDNLRILKFMNQEEVVQCLSGHEFYFQLSMMEGFPNALAEAMLCGCIPIGSNVSGIPHIIGDTGFILYTRQVDALNQLVITALADERRNVLSLSARNRISTLFTRQNRLDGLLKSVEGRLL